MVRNEHDTCVAGTFYRNAGFDGILLSVAAGRAELVVLDRDCIGCGQRRIAYLVLLLELISVALWIEIGIALTLPPAIWSVELLIRRASEGLPDARLLVAPVLLLHLVAFLVRTLSLGYVTGWSGIKPYWLFKTSTWRV